MLSLCSVSVIASIESGSLSLSDVAFYATLTCSVLNRSGFVATVEDTHTSFETVILPSNH